MATASPLRMASITLPLRDNQDSPIPAVHEMLKTDLLNTFGGYSRSEVDGAWLSDDGHVYHDHNAVYSVAMQDTPANQDWLRAIAREIGHEARQEAMMVVLPSGEIELLDTAVRVPA